MCLCVCVCVCVCAGKWGSWSVREIPASPPAGDLKGHADKALRYLSGATSQVKAHAPKRRGLWGEAAWVNIRSDFLRWSVFSRCQVTFLSASYFVQFGRIQSAPHEIVPETRSQSTAIIRPLFLWFPRLINWLADMSRIHHSWQFYY